MSENRRKPGLAFSAAATAALLGVYILSYGPALLLARQEVISHERVWLAYRPLVVATYDGPDWVGNGIMAYGNLWAGGGATSDVQFIEWEHRIVLEVRMMLRDLEDEDREAAIPD